MKGLKRGGFSPNGSDLTTKDFCHDENQARDTFVTKNFVAKNIELSETDRDLPKHVKNGFMRYRDFAPLTQGGEAILRTCVDENLGRVVVMKTLQPQFQNLETYQKRFLREARVTAQIPHPATIPVYELSRDADGNAYVAGWTTSSSRACGS